MATFGSTWKPSGAGMTPLPPSPEIKPASSQISDLEPLPFSLEGTQQQPRQQQSSHSRLRSIAKYQAFSPQALACSDPLPASTFSSSKYGTSTSGGTDTTTDGRIQNRHSGKQQQQQQPSSLGAVAGAQGVAVFRISKPHEPLMMLNHATSNRHHASAGGRPVSSLAFQPDASSSLYLAAARGSGVLLWDVSGHSLSPLLGRLAMDSEPDCVTTSLCWKLSQERDGIPLLATTTPSSACIWDLRSPLASKKPSIRFGGRSSASGGTTATRKTAGAANPYRQIACSRANECAVLDAAGTVCVFDVRMTDKSRFGANPLSAFHAFGHSGVGISYLALTATSANKTRAVTSAWVTWGWDSPDADAVVKVWCAHTSSTASTASDGVVKSDSTNKTGGSTATSSEDYWYMDGSPGRTSGTFAPYRLIAQCSPPYHLACPRVCPAPVENGILTIGIMDHDKMGANGGSRRLEGWRAELWKVRPNADETDSSERRIFGMEKVVSFDGGGDRDRGVLGKECRLGQLKAAELAITSYNPMGLHALKNDDDRMQDGAKALPNIGLALCCLGDNGFVTTHMIPEALPKKALTQSDGTNALSPQRSSLLPSSRAKVFADEREGVSWDAAGIWGDQGERPNRPVVSKTETRSGVESMRTVLASPVKESGGPSDPQQPSRTGDGAAMLFEMDVPAVAYGTVTAEGISGVQVGIDLSSPKVPVTSSMVEENDNTTAHVRDVAAMAERMDNIETERIPCPRLCGASFGPGIGGLAMFKNGDVKKMWFWYDRAGSSRLVGVPSSIIAPEQAFSDPGTASKIGGDGIHDTANLKVSIPRDSPRTMKDLMSMVKAVKETEWGEIDGSDNDSGDQEQSSGDNFYEYMSTGSISSDSDNEPVDFGGNVEVTLGKGSRAIYENYFGKFRRPLAEPSGGGNSKKTAEDGLSQSGSSTGGKVQVGPSSDTLAPSVYVTHDYDKAALNNQSAELAKEWELGQWQGDISSVVATSSERWMKWTHRDMADGAAPDSPLAHRGLPSYRGLSSPTKSRSNSDPLLPSLAPGKKVHMENEPGVHGGEYAVRPNMQESMVFLRKLFSHQQEGNAFPQTLLSPPDNPMLITKSRSVQSLPAMRQPSVRSGMSGEGRSTKVQPGVYALSSDTQSETMHEDEKRLCQIRSLCNHNADVCERVGEVGKQGVWKLLAQMVDRRLNERPDAFNGWGGKSGGALGVELVASFMRYYEALGDVQMLATMVCVLSGGQPRTNGSGKGNQFFLPEGHDEKYDTYLRRYSDLLFGWGLLVKRAELKKHLQRVQEREGKLLNDTAAEKERLPGIALVFTCPKCGNEAEFGTNVCRSCQEFALKCSICENGVRGLFIVCDICMHGGHVSHMASWFAKHTQCPSGCGCFCTFTAHPQRRSLTETNPNKAGMSFLPIHRGGVDPLDG
ncbi:GATOR complex protein WDR59 [Seminavis robusta]|uniref:GATOR complex protein WDR59 n=1 Tax=Seminavis robusta TaxID=568900 RepID=A0A9N8HK34_9STRA|nr:GATOR complex protein WDR59 [Seminavis robusta]|eukprot:Sro702_g190020.1 GATOR complex protein WDR59 (1421) ;mRNA; r:41497-46136